MTRGRPLTPKLPAFFQSPTSRQPARRAATLQVRRRGRDDEPPRQRQPDLDHVALDGLGEADAGVVALGDDVHESILGEDRAETAWGDAVLLYGKFGAVSSHPDSLALLRESRLEIRKRFKRIKAYYVGPQAERMLDSGMRLTLALQTPTTFDLAR